MPGAISKLVYWGLSVLHPTRFEKALKNPIFLLFVFSHILPCLAYVFHRYSGGRHESAWAGRSAKDRQSLVYVSALASH